jgi:hypothetical protein
MKKSFNYEPIILNGKYYNIDFDIDEKFLKIDADLTSSDLLRDNEDVFIKMLNNLGFEDVSLSNFEYNYGDKKFYFNLSYSKTSKKRSYPYYLEEDVIYINSDIWIDMFYNNLIQEDKTIFISSSDSNIQKSISINRIREIMFNTDTKRFYVEYESYDLKINNAFIVNSKIPRLVTQLDCLKDVDVFLILNRLKKELLIKSEIGLK